MERDWNWSQFPSSSRLLAKQGLPFTALWLFPPGIGAKSEGTEAACLNSVCGRTADENTFKDAEETLKQANLSYNMPGCVTTDGSKSIRVRTKKTNLERL